jgi:hypothetical protein
MKKLKSQVKSDLNRKTHIVISFLQFVIFASSKTKLMQSPSVKIRAEVLNRLQNSISRKESKDLVSNDVLHDLSTRLILVDNYTERKRIIKSWYGDLLSADRIRKHHLSYNKPIMNKQLNVFLSSLTSSFKKRFHGYMN